ncbi:MAG: flagellar basal body-associated FliL family protein [Minwuiales bacterium]|nr:flagellar basal body-associated FliL family protein [Minwuiales bacterium]
MSDVEQGESGEELDVDGEPQKKKLSGKKLVLMFILPGLLLTLAAGGGAAYFLGVFDPPPEEVAEKQENPANQQVLFYDLPEILVNLNTGGKQASYLKIRVALEIGSEEAIPVIEAMMPRVIDNFQVYLRELRREDLSGSAGIYRIKEELLIRVNSAVQPAHINDVLFKEMLVQ